MENCYFVETLVRRDPDPDGTPPLIKLEDAQPCTFENLKQAQAHVWSEARKLKMRLDTKVRKYPALAGQESCIIIERTAETKFACVDGAVLWRIRYIDDKGDITIPVHLEHDKQRYLTDEYGFPGDTQDVLCPPHLVLPYIAYTIAEGLAGKPETMHSTLDQDTGLPFKDTLAKKLIDDPVAEVITTNVGGLTQYAIQMKNAEHPFFSQPETGMLLVPEGGSADVYVEADFMFGDILVPIIKHFAITNGDITMMDIITDITHAISGMWSGIDEFFKGTPARFDVEGGGFDLYGISLSGIPCKVRICDENKSREFLERALHSIKPIWIEYWGPCAEPAPELS